VSELIVISGKGGTGKTSIAASLFKLTGGVAADCDVDASNLHLVVGHEVRKVTEFKGGMKAVIDEGMCTSCGKCADLCRFDAIERLDKGFQVDKFACEGCGVCAYFCPERAITLLEEYGGEWYISDTDSGPMVHARLAPGGENSGKLVTIVRNEAKTAAAAVGAGAIIVDGAPGIGCPVIASITGADAVLVVAEPTLSGMHDVKRVLLLAGHFGVKALLAVNRYDINEEIASSICGFASDGGIPVVGLVRYDPDVTRAQINGVSVIEYSDGPAAADIRRLQAAVSEQMGWRQDER
jgi:MinD superfamily P-loop ATPase